MRNHHFHRVSLSSDDGSTLAREQGQDYVLPRFSFESDVRSDISVETGALLGIFDMSFGVSRSNTQRTSRCTDQMSIIDHAQSMDKEDSNLVCYSLSRCSAIC